VKLKEQLDDVKPVVVTPTVPERSREVKLEPDPPPPSVDPEDLPGIAKDPKKPKPVPKPVDAKLSAGERALRALKADLGDFTDEAQSKKFSLPLRSLEDRVATRGGDAAFLAEVKELHNKVKEALAKQNQ